MTLVGRALAATTLVAVASGWAAANGEAAPAISWEKAFPTPEAGADVHFRARYTGGDGKAHQLEVWRHGSTFVRRRTDTELDVYAAAKVHRPGDYEYRVFDHRHRRVTASTRTDLYRIGVFTDWFGLAHVIERPKTRFTVRALATSAAPSRADCVWRSLEVAATPTTPARRTRICWSARWGLPLSIQEPGSSDGWNDQFTVEVVERKWLSRRETVMPPTPPTYAFVNADGEIGTAAD